jgi:hypothetical protein
MPQNPTLTRELIEQSGACAQCKANAKSNLAGGYRDAAQRCLDYCAAGHSERFPLSREQYVAGTWIEDEIDPADPNFRLVRMRIPHPPNLPGYQCGRVEGEAAMRKQVRAAAAQLAGAGALPEHIARAIYDAFVEPA